MEPSGIRDTSLALWPRLELIIDAHNQWIFHHLALCSIFSLVLAQEQNLGEYKFINHTLVKTKMHDSNFLSSS